jgi:hypothetical protein
LLIIFFGFGLLKTKSKLISPQFFISYIFQHAYLSFCKLRI